MYNIPDPETIRREIEASYERCKQYGINPEETRNPRQKRLTSGFRGSGFRGSGVQGSEFSVVSDAADLNSGQFKRNRNFIDS
jgi:hypothetical protein